MNPTHMRVPVGTTVTFLNPGAETFPNFPNQKLHCATQYFEGLFNSKLNPGQCFAVHVQSCRRILLQRLHRSASDGQGRSPT